MRLCPKMLLAATALLTASGAIAQERLPSPVPELVARLSYDSSGPVSQGDMRHVCMAVFRNGEYRIVRSWDELPAERLQGKMTKEESHRLFKLLESAEFRNLSGSRGGLIRQQAESFAAEIPSDDRLNTDGIREWSEREAWRLQWLNGDGQNPFPASVSKIVDWLQRFEAKDGKSFEYADYPDVCPAGGLRFLQPSVAEN
jgi:hypothetical protein